MNRSYRLVWNAAADAWVAVAEMTKACGKGRGRATLAAGVLGAALAAGPVTAQAALVSACSGVSLPQSVVTNIVGTTVLPLAS